eukprot:TRINITY_DN6737_c0_g1_i1.p1 TRINITY_DN6737_c0_g1~~TRINITY_DN6737_c0_g1_i1.p1  ORF type:complete len:209 (+),score=42.86 TRINITY_DN6737_c0_g1_i1:281-907(+)
MTRSNVSSPSFFGVRMYALTYIFVFLFLAMGIWLMYSPTHEKKDEIDGVSLHLESKPIHLTMESKEIPLKNPLVEIKSLSQQVAKDPRGYMMQVFQDLGKAESHDAPPHGFLHYVTLKPKTSPRGNHAHPDVEEVLYIVQGTLMMRAGKGQVVQDYILESPVAVKIPPGVCHAVQNQHLETGAILSYYITDPKGPFPRSNRTGCNLLI